MDLLTGYDIDDGRDKPGFGPHGTWLVERNERARCSQRPPVIVLDGRRRSDDPRTPSATGRGGGAGTYQTGLFGEEVVADGLERAGWRLLGHRVRTRVGEIDLVARRDDVVVFAEVKTAGPGRFAVEESVGERQRHRIRRAAVAWMAANTRLQGGVRRYRFDVFLVRRDADGAVIRIDHVKDAF